MTKPRAIEYIRNKKRCPNCKVILDHLTMWEKGEKKTMMMLIGNELVWEEVEFYPSGGDDYECPECNEVLCHEQDEAEKILRGEKICRGKRK